MPFAAGELGVAADYSATLAHSHHTLAALFCVCPVAVDNCATQRGIRDMEDVRTIDGPNGGVHQKGFATAQVLTGLGVVSNIYGGMSVKHGSVLGVCLHLLPLFAFLCMSLTVHGVCACSEELPQTVPQWQQRATRISPSVI